MSRKPINTSAEHVFDVLRFVSASQTPLGVGEIGESLGLPVSSAHRALVSLEEAGFVRRLEGAAKYSPGLMINQMSQALLLRFALYRPILGLVREISHLSGETAALILRIGTYGVFADVVEGSQEVYHARRTGEAFALHEQLGGLAILSTYGSQQREDFLSVLKDRSKGLSTKQSETLWKTISQGRKNGFVSQKYTAIETERKSVAIPIRAGDARCYAAIWLMGPAMDFDGEKIPERLQTILDKVHAFEASFQDQTPMCDSPFEHIPDGAIAL